MTFISNRRAEELSKPQEKFEVNNTKPTVEAKCIEPNPVKFTNDKIEVIKESKCNTGIINIFDDNNKSIKALKKDIMSGKDVHIKFSDFPNMSKEQIITAIFPDANKINSKSEHPFVYSNYFSKEAGKLAVNELVGGFVRSNGFSIQKSKTTFDDLQIKDKSSDKLPDLKPLPIHKDMITELNPLM